MTFKVDDTSILAYEQSLNVFIFHDANSFITKTIRPLDIHI